ncbi:hypothetical protein B5M47_03815 [candidate division CPR3 bacterium 4484_211]|uniref:Uncharacterized protein n=1 Tax=candidate division CPR3 bacterium 4484_211 TaxID=1968527 RepID=A0A1W9NW87_UNCC3|nr:MAG: hypothetical protein B5M47_03815 [candidate division CPR3 bacterium 4484_211]
MKSDRELKNLAISLAQADTEDEVVRILKNVQFWNNPSVWVDYDRNPNNFATIGNQQSSPDTALVEKIINSVDAVLMRECLRRGIKPDSPKAPKTIADTQKEYFGIYDGKLSSIDASIRSKIAENILLVATGQKSNPCYSIIDFGEGQTPKRIPETFLSLTKNNKIKIPFVQGKFGMGGSGVLQFCSKKYNLQLIISKRDSEIAKFENDDTKDMWGFTIVRREDPKDGMRNSSFRYLAPRGKILMFKANSLPLLPKEYPEPYGNPFSYGTFIKLYEYQLTGLKTIVKFDLYYRLSLLLPNIALPATLYERRKGYKAESYHIVLSGLSVRLDEDKRDNLEPGFPSSGGITAKGQKMDYLLYVFKKGKREKYTRNEGIIFTVNGQAHAFISKAFFERKNVGMSYLSDSILVIVDCSKFDGRSREDLFMNSRDRLREGELKNEIEKQLEDLIKNHQGLRALREQRRREEIENKLQDSKPLAEVLEKIIKTSPSLSSLFLEGVKIRNPFKITNAGKTKEYKGKRFPTYFKLTKDYQRSSPKKCPINRKFRVQFETDAENDYFNRDKDPGEFAIKINGTPISDYSLNLWNGLATLTVQLPEGVKVNDILHFKTEATDISRVDPFYNEFYILVGAPKKINNGGKGERRPPADDKKGEDRKQPLYLDLPNIIEVRREEWEKYNFKEDDALRVKDTGEGGYDFYVNMDNAYLKTEIKGNVKVDPRLLEARFKYGIVLVGISLLEFFEKRNKKEGDGNDLSSTYDKIANFTKGLSPVLLPMISSLGELELQS